MGSGSLLQLGSDLHALVRIHRRQFRAQSLRERPRLVHGPESRTGRRSWLGDGKALKRQGLYAHPRGTGQGKTSGPRMSIQPSACSSPAESILLRPGPAMWLIP